MTIRQKALPAGALPPQPRASSVVIGRQDYISVVLRLIAMEFYKLRRSMTAKIYVVVLLAFAIVIPVVAGILCLKDVNTPLSSFAHPLCSQVNSRPDQCDTHVLSQAELEQRKQQALHNDSDLLVLPASLQVMATLITHFIALLAMVLIGTIVGNEYSQGTIRVLFTRGPTRVQFLLAKVGLTVISVVPAVLGMMLVYILLGYAFHSLSGLALDFNFLTIDWAGHALLYLLVIIFALVMYGLLALLIATWWRSGIAGAVVPLLWVLILEPLVSQGMTALAGSLPGALGDILRAIPDYLPGNNITALLTNQQHVLFGQEPSALSDPHAWLVLLACAIIFVALACRRTMRRDVTN